MCIRDRRKRERERERKGEREREREREREKRERKRKSERERENAKRAGCHKVEKGVPTACPDRSEHHGAWHLVRIEASPVKRLHGAERVPEDHRPPNNPELVEE